MLLTAPLSGAPRRKNTLSLKGRKHKNYRLGFFIYLYYLPFLLTLTAYLSISLSVIFSISTLCFLAGFLPHLCFKGSLYIISPLVSAFTHLTQLSITLRCFYSLPSLSPTLVDRWLDVSVGCDRSGLLLTIILSLIDSRLP